MKKCESPGRVLRPQLAEMLFLGSLRRLVKKHLQSGKIYVTLSPRETLIFLAPVFSGARDQKEVQTTMNQYELALVVSAKIEDEARAAVVEQAKDLVTRFGGNITNVEDAGRKRLAYEIQKMKEGHYYFIQFDADATTPNEIEQRVRIMDNVIRFLCIRRDAE